jgi:hypothetical protein
MREGEQGWGVRFKHYECGCMGARGLFKFTSVMSMVDVLVDRMQSGRQDASRSVRRVCVCVQQFTAALLARFRVCEQ